MNKRKFISSFLTLALIANIGNFTLMCTATPNLDESSSINSTAALTKENFLSLPKEKLAEDFDYYWNTMKENSPLFNLTKRHNEKLEEQYQEYREKILQTDSNYEQLKLIDEFSRKFYGHNGILLNYISYLKNLYGSMPSRKQWSDMLTDPLTERNTDMYNDFKWEQWRLQKQALNTQNDAIREENVTTKIIEEKNIAYLKVRSFGVENIEKDGPIIAKFLDEVKDYNHLIIDITGNGGGSTDYMMNFANILKNAHTVTDYYLFKIGENSKNYINHAFSEDILPIDKLPEFKHLNSNDKKEMTHFYKNSLTFIPYPDKSKIFKGKVWILVDEAVFSASETFAKVCKDTKEATLVGRNTSGDGVGIDPAYIILPNSKVALRYTLEYGLNSDGSCNAEFGTKPDITSQDCETPLETCLKAIKESTQSIQ